MFLINPLSVFVLSGLGLSAPGFGPVRFAPSPFPLRSLPRLSFIYSLLFALRLFHVWSVSSCLLLVKTSRIFEITSVLSHFFSVVVCEPLYLGNRICRQSLNLIRSSLSSRNERHKPV